MSFIKSISMDEDAHGIWKERFGAYSQGFSSWVCDKLKEEHLDNMDSENKKQHIKDRKKVIKNEMEVLDLEATKIKNIEKEEKAEEKAQEKGILKQQIKKEKEAKENEKVREKQYNKFLKLVEKKYPKRPDVWVNTVFDRWFKGPYRNKGGWTMEEFAEIYETRPLNVED